MAAEPEISESYFFCYAPPPRPLPPLPITRLRLIKILSVHFGAVPGPDTTFEWAITDKHKVFTRQERTPLGFYEDFVSIKADSMVSIINDPRNPYHR